MRIPPADSSDPTHQDCPRVEHSATATFAPRLTNIVLGVEQGPQCLEEQDKMNGVASDTINTVSTDTHPIAAPTSPPADPTPRIRTVPEHSATATFAPRLTNIKTQD